MIFMLILLAAAGITFGLQHKLPFLYGKVSFVDSMLKCTYCTGFHGGWLAYIIAKAPEVSLQEMLLFAFASAIFSYALDELVKYFEESSYGDDAE